MSYPIRCPKQKALYNASPSQASDKPPPVLNLKIKTLTPTCTSVPSYVYHYIKNLLSKHGDYDVIKYTINIAKSYNDRIIALANLFYICVRQNKMTTIVFIFRELSDSEKLFVINSYDRLYTPIMHAAYDGSYDAVKLLIIYKADINITNINNEDIRSAALEGYKFSLTKLISIEQESRSIFIKPKYDKIIELIDNIRNNTLGDDINLNEFNFNKKLNSFEYKIINIENDIFKQLTETIIHCIEDCNTTIMCKLFIEINNLITDKIVNKDDIVNFINKYKNELNEEYPEEFLILNIE